MDPGVVAERPAQDFDGAVGNDLIGVHVKADAGAGLKNVNHKFFVPLTGRNLIGGLNDGAGDFRIDQSQIAIGRRRSFLHHAKGRNQRRVSAHPGNGIVLHRAHGLNSVIDVGRDFFGAKRIFFCSCSLNCTGHEGSWELEIIAIAEAPDSI